MYTFKKLLFFITVMFAFYACKEGDSSNENMEETIEETTEAKTTEVEKNINEISVLVKENFIKMYPGEDDPDWALDSNGNWEANFKIDGVKYRADYKPDGSWIETENSIDKDELPDVIKKMIKKDYGDSEITEVEFVKSAEKGSFYDVEFKRKGKNKDVMFRENGEIIKE